MDPEHRFEPVDVTPVEVPAYYKAPLTIKQELQRYVRYELSKQAQQEGFETFKEFEDYELEPEDEDEPEWASEYEFSEMDEEVLGEGLAEPASDGESAQPEEGPSTPSSLEDPSSDPSGGPSTPPDSA